MAENTSNVDGNHAEIKPKFGVRVNLEQFTALIGKEIKFELIVFDNGREHKTIVGLTELKAIIDDMYLYTAMAASRACHNLKMGLDVMGRDKKGQDGKQKK